jgi:chromosome segregation ATPase
MTRLSLTHVVAICVAWSVLTALPVRAERPNAKAREEWMAGFVKLEEGGKAEESANMALALELYREALSSFLEVRRKYPSWNPSLLNYRITYCEERIRRLEGDIKSQSGAMTQAELADVVQGQVEKISALTEENGDLKRKLALASEALERARREAARTVGAGEDIKQLMAEKKAVEDENRLHKVQIEQLSAELKTLRDATGLREAAKKLADELARTKERETQLEKAFDVYRRAYENVKARLKDTSLEREAAQREQQALQQKVAALEERNAALGREMESQRQATSGAQNQIQALERKLKAKDDELAAARDAAAQFEKEALRLRTFRDRSVEVAGEKGKLVAQVQELLAQKKQLGDRVDTLQASLRDSETKAKDAGNALADLRKKLDDKEKATEKAVTQLEKDVAAAREEVAAKAAAIIGLEERLKQKDDQVEQLTAELRSARQAGHAQEDGIDGERDDGEGPDAVAGKQKALEELDRKQREIEEKLAAKEQELARLNALGSGAAAADQWIKGERRKLVARVDDLEDKLAESTRTVETLTAQTADLEDARKAAVAKLEARNEQEEVAKRLRADLDEARAELARQKDIAETQKKQLAETAALGRMLKAKEDALKDEQDRVGDLREKLEASQTALQTVRQELDNAAFAEKRLKHQVAMLEKQNLDISREAREKGLSRKKWDVLEAQLREQLTEAQDVAKTLEQERDRLTAKIDEQVRLLRRQEDSIAKLEAKQAEFETERRKDEEKLNELRAEMKLMQAKTEVVDGLAASLTDADANLKKLVAELEQARERRDAAVAQVRDMQTQIEDRQREIQNYRQMLEQKQGDGVGAEGKLVKQVRELSRQLEKESQRRRALEAALAQQGSAGNQNVTRTPEPAPVSTDAERDRREREQLMLLRGYLRQGLAAEKGGNIEAARWNYQRVLDHDGENEVAAQRLGLIAAEQGDDEEAVRYLKRAFHLDPDDLNTLLPLGFALVRQSSPDLAISMLSRAVALEPDNPDAHRCLGIACSTLGWYDAAEVQFRRTYKLDEKDAENAFNMAVLLATREPPRLEEAKKWYARAKELGVAADPGLDAVFGLSN